MIHRLGLVGTKNNLWLMASVGMVMIAILGLSIWHDILLVMAVLCLVAVVGGFTLFLALTRPIWLLYFLCFLIPFSQSIPTISVGGRTLHIGFDTIIVGFILLGYIIRMIIAKRRSYTVDKASKWLLIWWGWNLFSLALAMTHLPGIAKSDAVIVFMRWSQFIPIFFVIINMNISSQQVKIFVKIILFSGFLIAGVNVFEQFILGVDITQTRGAGLVMKGVFTGAENYNIVGVYLAIVILLLTPFILSAHKLRKRVGILIILFLFAGIWFTTSRSSLLTVLIGFGFLGILFFPRPFFRLTIVSVPVGMTILWLLRDSRVVQNFLKFRYLPQALPMLYGASLESLGLPGNAGGGVMRLYFWGNAVRFWMQNPLLGHGFRATRWMLGTQAYFTADNYYLELLADTGLIGLIFMLLFFIALFLSSFSLYKRAGKDRFLRKFSAGYTGVFIGLIFVSLVGSFFMSQKIWGIFIMLSALLCNQLRSNRKRRQAIQASYFPKA